MIDFLIVNLIISSLGLYIASYIYHQKHKKKPLVCMAHHSCDDVINSRYGNFLKIDNSLMGILYFGGIVLMQPVAFFFPVSLFSLSLHAWMAFAGLAAALFSWLLLGIMEFVLGQRCTWCIASFFVSNTLALTLWCSYVTIK